MATRPARFEFNCCKGKLNFTHNIPISLFGPVKLDSLEFMSTFASTVRPIILQHDDAALNATQPLCCICEAPKTRVVLTPMSLLHHASDPFVYVMVCPACHKPECETYIRQNVQVLTDEMAGAKTVAAAVASPDARKATEIMPCRVCNTVEKTFRCGRCGTAFYCGKEHQKLDWPTHKMACRLTSRAAHGSAA